MTNLKVYHHDTNGVFLGVGEAAPNPREPNQPLIPALSTLVKPPALAAKQTALWDGTAWTVADDWRGHEFWLADGTRYVISDIGEKPPADALSEPPPMPPDVAVQVRLVELNSYAENLLTALPYDGRIFDVSGRKEDLVHKWYSGAQAYGELWGGGNWIHVEGASYPINNAADCAAWAMTMFALAAGVHNARDDHEVALRALGTADEIEAYDIAAGWPS